MSREFLKERFQFVLIP